MFDDTLATDPTLQLHLEKVMVALDYDLKEFLRVLYNTKTFQRQVVARDVIPKDNKDTQMPVDVQWIIAGPNIEKQSQNAVPYFYQGPMLERMSGEQIWDSLVNLTFDNVDSRKLKKIYEIYGDDYVVYSKDTEEEQVELRLPNEFQSLLKVPKGKINPF